MAGLAAVMAACTSDEAAQQTDGSRVPVGLSYTTQPLVQTRAAASTTLNNDYIEVGKQVTVRISETHPSDYTTGSFDEYKYTAGESGALALPSPAPYYPLNGTNVDILAYYPSFDGTEFSIQTDQTGNDAYAASDLMWAEPIINTAKSTSNKTLTFAHKMAKLIVTATAGTAVTQINSVTLKQVKPTVTFNKLTGAVSGLTGDAGDVKIVKNETATSVSGAAVIPDQTIKGALLEIGVTLEGGTPGTATYTVPSGKTFTAGSVYTLDITVSYPEVEAETAITGWTEGGTAIIQRSTVQQTFDVDNNSILTFNVSGVQFQMIAVKGGNYTTFGGTTVTGTLTDYYIGQTEVTNALWYAVMGSKPSAWSAAGTNDGQPNTGDQYPVCFVSWNDICTASTGFLAKLNAAVAGQLPSGKTFKLPSEAQWEYAARGGNALKTYTYSGSATIGDVAWYTDNSTVSETKQTHPVATKQANSLGLYDMSGNVWEWCQDWYNSTVTTSQGTDFVQTTEGSSRVYRGGSWDHTAAHCAVSYRNYGTPTLRNYSLGFRLVLQ